MKRLFNAVVPLVGGYGPHWPKGDASGFMTGPRPPIENKPFVKDPGISSKDPSSTSMLSEAQLKSRCQVPRLVVMLQKGRDRRARVLECSAPYLSHPAEAWGHAIQVEEA